MWLARFPVYEGFPLKPERVRIVKKNRISKLRVSRETLRNLSDRDLRGVAGGICTGANCHPTISRTAPLSTCTDDCCTDTCTETCTGTVDC